MYQKEPCIYTPEVIKLLTIQRRLQDFNSYYLPKATTFLGVEAQDEIHLLIKLS